jgi:hypothetical protein
METLQTDWMRTMEWEKLGVVWQPTGEAEWAHTHATLPVVDASRPGEWRVYVSTRDAAGKSRVARLRVDLAGLNEHKLPQVTAFDPQPVLEFGPAGSFDDSGVMPSWLVNHGDEQRLYYIGWNVVGTVPYRLSIGMAVSRDGGESFERYATGPLIDRSLDEPFFATAPCVMQDGGQWRMWYISCTGWQLIHDRWEPSYHVKYAESPDGIRWRITGRSCVEAAHGEAIGRPCVFRRDAGYGMFYSYRSTTDYRTRPQQAYRLGYAESNDGLEWTRRDDAVGIATGDAGWDSEMIEYCWVQQQGAETYLLYNGNGFGKSGFGIARLKQEL